MAFLAPAIGALLTGASVATALARVAIGLVLSAVVGANQRARAAGRQQSGIATKFTGKGEDTPQSIILGTYATAGHQMCPRYTHARGSDPSGSFFLNPGALAQRILDGLHDPEPEFGSIDNGDYATFIISLADHALTGLQGVYIDGVYFDVATHLSGAVHPFYGTSVASGVDRDDYVGNVWVKFYDGTQTEVDHYLLSAYGTHPTRPWLSTSVHRGSAYAIVTLRRTKKLFQTFIPDNGFRFVVTGMALLDPRTGVIGPTKNAIVMAWNIGRNITMPDGSTFGLSIDDADMPAAWWHTAMDACDAAVANQSGGTEPAYRAGLEIPIATPDDGGMDPLTVWDELFAAAQAEIVCIGGTWLVRVGPATAAVATLTDDDFLVSQDQSAEPFQGLRDTYNMVTATFPNPDAKWEVTEAPRRIDAAAIAADGEELPVDLTLNAVPYPDQVQRIMASELRNLQRRRAHTNVLSRGHNILALDAFAWTSDIHGYTDKLFEVNEMVVDLETGTTALSFRETEPTDFDVDPTEYQPQPVPVAPTLPPPPLAFSSVNAEPYTHSDGTNDRIPAIRLTWSIDTTLLTGVAWTITRDGVLVDRDSTGFASAGEKIVTEGLLRDTTYQVVLEPIISGQVGLPSAPITVTTPDVGIGTAALGDDVWDAISDDATNIASSLVTDFATNVTDPLVADIGSVDDYLELLDIRQRDQGAALAQIGEQILWGIVNQAQTQNLVRDAGIYTDPEDGQVRISAVEAIRDDLTSRVSQAEILVNAQNAQIQLFTTFAEVEGIVAAAQLNEVDFAAFNDVNLRLSTVEVNQSALEGALTLKAETTTVNQVNARVDTIEIDLDSVEQSLALKLDTADFTDVETRLGSAELAISTLNGPAITQTVADVRYLSESLSAADMANLETVLGAYRTREALREDIAFATQDMRALVSEDRAAIAELGQALGASIDDNVALIEVERQARADADGALAQSIENLDARTTQGEASITALNQVSADSASPNAQALHAVQAQVTTQAADIAGAATATQQLDARVTATEQGLTSQAQQVTSISTTVGENTTSINEQSLSIDGIFAERTIQINQNGHVSGLVLRSELNDAGAVVSEVAFVSDKFAIVGPGAAPLSPFVVYSTPTLVNGVLVPAGVYIETAFIQDGSIGAAQIAEAAIGRAKIEDVIESDNYAEDADGRPTNGLKLDFATGGIKAADVVLSRNIVLNSGSFTYSGTLNDQDEIRFVNSGIRMGREDVWNASKNAVIVSAAVTSAAQGPSGLDPLNTFFALEAVPLTGGRWFGMSAGAPSQVWQQDPSTLADWPGQSDTDGRFFFNLKVHTEGGAFFQNPTIGWKVFLVT